MSEVKDAKKEQQEQVVEVEVLEENGLEVAGKGLNKKKDKNKPRIPFLERLRLKKNRIIAIALMSLLVLGAFLPSFVGASGAAQEGAKVAAEAFTEAEQQAENDVYQEFYDHSYEQALEDYRVENRVEIDVAGVREEAQLEVVQASTVVYMTDKEGSSESWIEVPGTGVFTVDLTAAEYLVDQERSYVLIRLPQPELSNTTIDTGNIKRVLFQNGTFDNGSVSAGEDLARKQLKDAQMEIKSELMGNQDFYKCAKDSAELLVESLVRSLNPDVQDLEVEIEFMD